MYLFVGRVTEFRYCAKIAAGVKNFGELSNLVDFSWNMSPSDRAFVFVDNHDNQRGHGGAGTSISIPLFDLT
jgi:alpha-amylase